MINKKIISKVEKCITIIIPSKIFDENLTNCVNKIRKFYRKIKIILVLDKPSKIKLDKNIKILISGSKTIGFKRNMGAKHVKTKLICLIDSDAYPNSYWLNESLDILNYKQISSAGGPNISPKTNNIEKILVARIRKLSFVTLNPKMKSNKIKKHYLYFLPSCNLIIKTSIYKKANGMDSKFYSGEEISLNVFQKKWVIKCFLILKFQFFIWIEILNIFRDKGLSMDQLDYGSS